MLKYNDKVYFVKSLWYNIDLPSNTKLTISHIFRTNHPLKKGEWITVIKIREDTNEDDYYSYQFLSLKDYRKEKLKTIEKSMIDA